jgi:cold shock CspA family protein
MTTMTTDSASTRVGIVRWFDTTRGFGFIWPDDAHLGRQRALVFVHFRDVMNEEYLRPGEPVTFHLEERRDRPGQLKAVRVRRAASLNPARQGDPDALRHADEADVDLGVRIAELGG